MADINVTGFALDAALSACEDQDAQILVLMAPYVDGVVTVRVMSGSTTLSVLTHSAWVRDAASVPRKATLGAFLARSFLTAGTPTRVVFAANGTDQFELDAGVLAGSASFSGPVTSGSRERLDGLAITATAALPIVSGAPVHLLTFLAPDTATVNTGVSVTIANNGTEAESWTIDPPIGFSLSATFGTVAPGATTTLIGVADFAGTYALTLVCAGATITGATQSIVASGAVAEAPPGVLQDARDAQVYLFQASPAASIPSRLTANPLHNLAYDVWGPTNKWVDMHTQWLWTNLGGDWIDSALTPQGTVAWGSVTTPTGNVGQVYDHSINLTAALQNVQANSRWCAFSLVGGASYRAVASHRYTPDPTKRPKIVVTYTDTTTATLDCWVCATTSGASASPATTQETMPVPLNGSTDRLFMEFARPTKPVASAVLYFSVTQQQWGGSVPISVRGILTPPTRGAVVAGGIAQTTTGLLDAGVPAHPSTIFVQRILDGTPSTDFVAPIEISYTDSDFSPELFGGAVNTAKLPYIHPGKWINGNDLTPTPPTDQFNLTKVESSYAGEGFVPLAPGLGALRTHVDGIAVLDGDMVGNGGIGICNARMPLPIDRIGLQDRIFIRWYERAHMVPIYSPMSPENRKHVWQDAGHTTPRWTDRSGKGGLGPNHQTADGGFSGSSGGRWGWQMRNSWYLCDANMGGPDEGTISYGFHLYDYLTNNPVGHQYGSANIGIGERFGNKGGYGGTQEFDRWYCHETEIKLNTVNGVTYPDFIADGYLRHWIDGRLVYERTGMVFRQLPHTTSRPIGANYLTPIRELGVREVILNVFYGGQTWNTEALTFFYTGIVVSDEYIGPMQLPAPGATSLTVALQSTGQAGVAVDVTVTPNGPMTGGGTATLAATAGTLGSTTLTWTDGETGPKTTTLLMATAGGSVITMTNSAGLENLGSPASFTAMAPSASFSSVALISTNGSPPLDTTNQWVVLSLHGSGTNYDLFYGRKYTADLPAGLTYETDNQFKFAIQNSTSGSTPTQMTILPNDRQENLPNGNRREMFWMGVNATPGAGNPVDMVMERRLDAMMSWFDANYPQASATRRVATGGSMGAYGTFTYALKRPTKFAALYPDRPRWRSASTPNTIWCPSWSTGATNVYPFGAGPSLNPADGGYPLQEHLDHLAWISNPANDLPWIGWCVGKADGYTPFEDHIAAVAALRARGAGFAFYWNSGNHSEGAKLSFELFPTYPVYLWEIGKGYPVFSEHSLDDDPATAAEGGINIGLSFRNVVESAGAWSCEVRHQGTTFRPAQACTVRVKPKSSIYTGNPPAQLVNLPSGGSWVTVSF